MNEARVRDGGDARAAVEGEALERRRGFLRLGSAPFRCPLRLRDEHPILAVLLLPHFACSGAQKLKTKTSLYTAALSRTN